MRLKKALNEKILDVRLRDKLVQEGEKLNTAEVEKYLKQLPDDQANVSYTEPDADKAPQQ